MRYVFGTSNLKRDEFPTHINDIVVDRAEAKVSEVFVVAIHPGSAPPLHKHDDTEQVFYVLEGQGTLTVGGRRKQFPVAPGDVVRVPMSTWHSIGRERDRLEVPLCRLLRGRSRRGRADVGRPRQDTLPGAGLDYSQVVRP